MVSKIKNFENRQEFERAFLPEWKVVELSETAKAFSDFKRKHDQKIAGFDLKYPIGADHTISPPNSYIGLKTVCWFG